MKLEISMEKSIQKLEKNLEIRTIKEAKEYIENCPTKKLTNMLEAKLKEQKYPQNYNKTEELIIDSNIILNKLKDREEKDLTSLFAEFERLSKVMEWTSLTAKEQFLVILYFIQEDINKIEINLNKGLKPIFITNDDIKSFKFQTIKTEQIEEMLENRSLKDLINADDEELTREQILQKNELRTFISKEKNHTRKVISWLQTVKNSYLQKTDNYTELDIEKVIKSLQKLQIINPVCTNIKEYLQYELKKRKNKPKTITKNFSNNISEEEPYEIRYARLRKIEKKLRDYINLEDLTINRALSYEQQNMVIANLIEYGGISEKKMLEFLKRTNRECPVRENPITEYLRICNKLSFYHIECPEQELAEECFQELFFTNNQKEDYQVILNLLKEYLKDIKDIIPNDYQYELEQGKKLVRSKN